MRMGRHLINQHFGAVVAISKNKLVITIQLPNGGKLTAPNEGFSLGDEVCFDMNPDGDVTKVTPKLVADTIMKISLDDLLKSYVNDAPELTDEELLELEASLRDLRDSLIQEDGTDDEEDEFDDPGNDGTIYDFELE